MALLFLHVDSCITECFSVNTVDEKTSLDIGETGVVLF